MVDRAPDPLRRMQTQCSFGYLWLQHGGGASVAVTGSGAETIESSSFTHQDIEELL